MTAPESAAPLPPEESVAKNLSPDRDEQLNSTLVEPASGENAASATTDSMNRFLDEVDASDMYIVPANALRGIQAIRAGRLSPEIAEMLALSADEVARVNTVFELAEENLNESERARVKIESASETEVVLHIPASVEEGRQIEERFREGLIDALGDVDGTLLLAALDYSPAHNVFFNEFGTVDRKLTFAIEPKSDDTLLLRFRNESPRENAEGSRTWLHGRRLSRFSPPHYDITFEAPHSGPARADALHLCGVRRSVCRKSETSTSAPSSVI